MNPIMIGILVGFGVFAIMMIVMTIYQKKKATNSNPYHAEMNKEVTASSPMHSKPEAKDDYGIDEIAKIMNANHEPEDVPSNFNMADILNPNHPTQPMNSLEECIIDIPQKKTIRVTKTNRLLNKVGTNFQNVSPKLFTDLLTYDPMGFTFYRWVMTKDPISGIYLDENKMEGFPFRQMLDEEIPFESIDLIVYGADALRKIKDDIRLDVNWWKFEHCVIFRPMAINYVEVIRDFIKSQQFGIISSDCLLGVLDSIEGTAYATPEMKNTLLDRSEEISSVTEQKEGAQISSSLRTYNVLKSSPKTEEETEELLKEIPHSNIIQGVISVEPIGGMEDDSNNGSQTQIAAEG